MSTQKTAVEIGHNLNVVCNWDYKQPQVGKANQLRFVEIYTRFKKRRWSMRLCQIETITEEKSIIFLQMGTQRL